MNRRKFFKVTGSAGIAACSGISPLLMNVFAFADYANLSRKEASFYKKLEDREIECTLCPRFCRLGDKERGYCGVRENINGTYFTLVYGKACSIHIDPIEKKPFFHFLPRSPALSIASAGCNVNCKFCQNWEISQVRPEQIHHMDFPPDTVIKVAEKNNCPVIAYTYSEPVVFYEYMYDTSIQARNQNIKNVVVTGGLINQEPLERLMNVVDAIKVDLKSFSESFYSRYVQGELKPVLEAIKIIAQSKVWLEIVYLVIPQLNDSPEEIKSMTRWLLKEVGPDVPLHFSRFYPMYLMKNLPPTPLSTLERAYKIAVQEGFRYVYIGNIPGHESENTFCPRCKNKVIQRKGFHVSKIAIKEGRCEHCQNIIPGVWS